MKKIIFIPLIITMLVLSGCSSESSQDGYYSDGYDSGYSWAEDYDIDNFDSCQDEFGTGDAEDGCNDYVRDNYSGYQSFGGYECTEDCSGHEAGYEWAEDNGIYSFDDCGGNSDSFIEGCQAYVEENY
jgi:hypothetical protein